MNYYLVGLQDNLKPENAEKVRFQQSKIRVRAPKTEMRSICGVQTTIFEKARKKAKNEENQRKSPVFPCRSF